VSGSPVDAEGLPRGYPFRAAYEITAREAKRLLDAGGDAIVIIDVRTVPEWEHAHVPGSILIPLDEIERRADEVAPAPGQMVACLCHHGVRSAQVAGFLEQRHGFASVTNFSGGIDAWSVQVDATVPRY
jgi:rhodanese-related sulfurtransferase